MTAKMFDFPAPSRAVVDGPPPITEGPVAPIYKIGLLAPKIPVLSKFDPASMGFSGLTYLGSIGSSSIKHPYSSAVDTIIGYSDVVYVGDGK